MGLLVKVGQSQRFDKCSLERERVVRHGFKDRLSSYALMGRLCNYEVCLVGLDMPAQHHRGRLAAIKLHRWFRLLPDVLLDRKHPSEKLKKGMVMMEVYRSSEEPGK